MVRRVVRLWVACLCTLVVVSLVGCSGSGGSEAAPSSDDGDDFCEVLRDGTGGLDEQTSQAGDTTEEQAALLAENFADLSRLLRRLEEVAPDELRSDMDTVVETWESQADTAEQVANNPLGGLAATLVQALLAGSSFEAVDAYAQEYCGRTLFGPTVSPEEVAESATTTTTTSPDLPPEPALVVCDIENLQLSQVGLDSGEIRHQTSDHSAASSEVSNLSVDGETTNLTQGIGLVVCGDSDPTLFSADYRYIVGVATYEDGSQIPVTVDLESASLDIAPAVEAPPLNDFGSARPETLTAAFTPDREGLFWRESHEGSCVSYLAPSFTPGETIPRDSVEQYRIGEGGACFNTELFVRWAGDTPLVCDQSYEVFCDDANGNEADEPVLPGGQTGSVAGELPESERYALGHVSVEKNAFYVSETGLTYFVGVDSTMDRSVLFSWSGGGSQPTEVRDLGPGTFVIAGFIPAG